MVWKNVEHAIFGWMMLDATLLDVVSFTFCLKHDAPSFARRQMKNTSYCLGGIWWSLDSAGFSGDLQKNEMNKKHLMKFDESEEALNVHASIAWKVSDDIENWNAPCFSSLHLTSMFSLTFFKTSNQLRMSEKKFILSQGREHCISWR